MERLSALIRANPAAAQALARQRGIVISSSSSASGDGGRVRAIVELHRVGSVFASAAWLEALGGEVEDRFGHWVRAWLPLDPDRLRRIADRPEVRYVRLPYTPYPAGVRSEGVSLIGADAFQSNGLAGQGVTVAVIDLGFDGLQAAIGSGELPSNVIQRDYTRQGMGGTAHGTAVAEIVHDVAPGARLILMKVADEVGLARAAEEALQEGARVINHSVVWFNTEFGDGRGEVSQIASQAVARGAVWVNAAGNTANLHWQGAFRDEDDDGWAEFYGSSETLQLQAGAGERIEVFLSWDDWPQTGVDYDLYLAYDANGNGRVDPGETVAASTDPQRGLDPPTEELHLPAPQAGRYFLSVLYVHSGPPAATPDIELFSVRHTLRPAVAEGSVLAPATAAEVLAVGAVHQADWSWGTLEPFSAQGPTRDGRVKPDLVAPDAVSTLTAARFPAQFGGDGRFSGTSAAAPHVAGAAALLLSEAPGRSPAQVRAKLLRDAWDLAPAGPDNRSGSGRIQLRLEPVELPLELSALKVEPVTVAVNAEVAISLTARNPHPRPVGSSLPLYVDGAVAAVQEVVLEPNESTVVRFLWRFTRPGRHRLTVGDLPPVTVEVFQPLKVTDITLRPSPLTAEGAQLRVHGRGITGVRLDLYDLAGRRLLSAQGAGDGLRLLALDGKGRPLADGVYLYTVTVTGRDGQLQSPIRKLLVLR